MHFVRAVLAAGSTGADHLAHHLADLNSAASDRFQRWRGACLGQEHFVLASEDAWLSGVVPQRSFNLNSSVALPRLEPTDTKNDGIQAVRAKRGLPLAFTKHRLQPDNASVHPVNTINRQPCPERGQRHPKRWPYKCFRPGDGKTRRQGPVDDHDLRLGCKVAYDDATVTGLPTHQFSQVAQPATRCTPSINFREPMKREEQNR